MDPNLVFEMDEAVRFEYDYFSFPHQYLGIFTVRSTASTVLSNVISLSECRDKILKTK